MSVNVIITVVCEPSQEAEVLEAIENATLEGVVESPGRIRLTNLFGSDPDDVTYELECYGYQTVTEVES